MSETQKQDHRKLDWFPEDNWRLLLTGSNQSLGQTVKFSNSSAELENVILSQWNLYNFPTMPSYPMTPKLPHSTDYGYWSVHIAVMWQKDKRDICHIKTKKIQWFVICNQKVIPLSDMCCFCTFFLCIICIVLSLGPGKTIVSQYLVLIICQIFGCDNDEDTHCDLLVDMWYSRCPTAPSEIQQHRTNI